MATIETFRERNKAVIEHLNAQMLARFGMTLETFAKKIKPVEVDSIFSRSVKNDPVFRWSVKDKEEDE